MRRFSSLPSIKRFGEILHEHYSSSSPLIFERKKHLSNVEQFFSFFGEKREHSYKLQSEIMDAVRGLRLMHLRKQMDEEQRARRISRANKYSARVWRAYPLVQEFALTDEEMRFQVAYATGTTPPGLPQHCTCSKDLTLSTF